MSALRPLWLILLLAPIVLVIDLVWLGMIMKGFYAQEIGEITRKNADGMAPRWGAAMLVYVLIPAGLVFFVRPLLTEQSTLVHAWAWGALFGLILYGVYDMTNLAVLDKWTVRVSLADMAWGGVLGGITAVIMRAIDRWL